MRTLSLPLDVRGRLVVAHRGAHTRAPENSLASIREARALGVDLVELDVRTTRDGTLVLLHDESVERTTDGSGDVAELDLPQVRELSLDAGDSAFLGERVPLLQEAVDLACQGGPGIYLHVKVAAPEAIARALQQVPKGRVLVFTEDRAWLERFHQLAPDRDVLPLAQWDTPGELQRIFAASAIAYDDGEFSHDDGLEVHALGMKAIVDVLGSGEVEARTIETLALGADGVQTDEPERVNGALGRPRG